jgi:hypothetical protein
MNRFVPHLTSGLLCSSLPEELCELWVLRMDRYYPFRPQHLSDSSDFKRIVVS